MVLSHRSRADFWKGAFFVTVIMKTQGGVLGYVTEPMEGKDEVA